jgi:predicted lipoprotein with Yx(FWY)xxD motif
MSVRSRVLGVLGAAALAAVSAVPSASAAPARPAARPHVITAGVISLNEGTKWGNVLANRSKHTLYLLTSEVGFHITCTKANGCWSVWAPLLLTKGTKVSIGTGVKGQIRVFSVNSTEDQVAFNSYPVYTYLGDSGPAQQHGEGLSSFGGTWYMLRATATTAATTPVK